MIWAAILKNWKPIALGLVVLALVVAGAFAVKSGINTVHEMVAAARQQAIAERDAFWRGKIAESNAQAAAAQAEQALKVAGLEAALSAAQIDTQAQLDRLEKDDAALPDGDAIGLDAARVRLLPRTRPAEDRGANGAGQATGTPVVPHPMPGRAGAHP